MSIQRLRGNFQIYFKIYYRVQMDGYRNDDVIIDCNRSHSASLALFGPQRPYFHDNFMYHTFSTRTVPVVDIGDNL